MYIVKLVGMILIVASSSLIGFLKSHTLSSRHKKLLLIYDGVTLLYEYVECGGCDLAIAVKNSFSKCAFLSFENERLVCVDYDLKKDKNLLEQFFAGLGHCVKKVECARIIDFKQKIKSRLNEAQNDMQQKGKVYQTFGVCVGLAVAILLI